MRLTTWMGAHRWGAWCAKPTILYDGTFAFPQQWQTHRRDERSGHQRVMTTEFATTRGTYVPVRSLTMVLNTVQSLNESHNNYDTRVPAGRGRRAGAPVRP